MNRMLGFLTAVVLGTSASVASWAQYTGPGATKMPATVAEVLKNPKDDEQVVLRGKLLKKVSEEKFLFSDGTGEIRVDIDSSLFRGQTVSENTLVEIHGEIEKDFMTSPEVDVDRLSVVNP